MQEIFDLIRMLNEEFPRVTNKETKLGLSIELKDWEWIMLYSGHNTVDLVYEGLIQNGLSTIDQSKNDIPIIIQSFEEEPLDYFKTLSDFPLIICTHTNGMEFLQASYRTLKGWFLNIPPVHNRV